MADPFVAEIRILPFNSFVPMGWATCDGQLMQLKQNTALFSLLGTTYGGDGKNTFGLPDLRGRAPMHPGQGPGLSLHDLGETGGSETVTLLESEMPSHNHNVKAASPQDPGNLQVGGPSRVFAVSANGNAYNDPASLVPEAAQTIGPTGGYQAHNNMQPYLTCNYCIALVGVFPPRG